MTCTAEAWTGLYSDSWQGLCVPAAFAHPAKYSRGLIQRIYEHAREAGWLTPGAWVLDPFSGVSLGAHDALLMGYNVLHVELEIKFHLLAQENVALWQRRYGHLPGYGQAVLLQGDSRRLGELVQGPLAACVSSPPYNLPMSQDHNGSRGGRRGTTPSEQGAFAKYGNTPGQLEGMPMGDITACVASPPYAASDQNYAAGWQRIDHAKLVHTRHTSNMDASYGSSPGQLAALPVGAVVASPPWDTGAPALIPERQRVSSSPKDHGGPGPQYAAMPTLGEPTTFWEAATTILRQVYALLQPGGHAIFVTKNYVRNSQIVPFTQQWIAVCESVGLQLLHHHRAMLVEDHGTQTGLFGEDTQHQTLKASFFRRLHMKKRPDLAILSEDVTCYVKAGDTGAGVACCVASPPYAQSVHDGNGIDATKLTGNTPGRHSQAHAEGYGRMPGQLGSMPPGETP